MAALPFSVQASQQLNPRSNEKTWTGNLTAVNAQDKTFTGEHWLASKTFHLGENCALSTIDNKQASLSDLRPGIDVRVRYRDLEGVLVADRIAEKPLHYAGRIQAIDRNGRTIAMEEAPFYKPFRAPRTFHIATDCKMRLGNHESGTLAALQPGDRISILYERHNGKSVAYRIGDKSMTFKGRLEAIDMSSRTVKAKEMSTRKNFNLADHCQIVVNGKRIAHLKDLVLGHQYQFTYEKVNGVNVLDRIAPIPGVKPSETASTS